MEAPEVANFAGVKRKFAALPLTANLVGFRQVGEMRDSHALAPELRHDVGPQVVAASPRD